MMLSYNYRSQNHLATIIITQHHLITHHLLFKIQIPLQAQTIQVQPQQAQAQLQVRVHLQALLRLQL